MAQQKNVNSNTQLTELGRRIKAVRTQKKLSQECLALNSGIDPSYMGRIERGENSPTYLMLLAISKTLMVSIKELI